MAYFHNEYLNEYTIPFKLHTTLENIPEEQFDELSDLMYKKFPIIDTFHADCITFQWAFNSDTEERNECKLMVAEIRKFLKEVQK